MSRRKLVKRAVDEALRKVPDSDVTTAELGSGTADATTFLRGDRVWEVPAGGGGGAPTTADYLVKTANATLTAERVVTDTASVVFDWSVAGQAKANVQFGSTATTATVGNDARLSDARTPLAHKASHENGGADELSVAGLNGVLADPQPPIIGATATTAVAGNDVRLTDSRTPLAHTLDGALHTVSGLTAGHVMRASAATTFAFGALLDADIPATIARDSEVTTAITNHEAAVDPHPQYTLSTELAAHEAAADPHIGYQKESEKNAASGYPGIAAVPGTMDSSTVLYGDGVYRSPSAGSTNVQPIALAFGTIPVKTKKFTITDAAVTASSQIMVTAGDSDEWEMEPFDFFAKPAAGSYEITAYSLMPGKFDLGAIKGTHNVHVLVG